MEEDITLDSDTKTESNDNIIVIDEEASPAVAATDTIDIDGDDNFESNVIDIRRN